MYKQEGSTHHFTMAVAAVVVVIHLLFASLVTAVPQTVTFYEGSQMTGNSITFGQKEPNITNYSFFPDKSHCFVGSWFLYREVNYMARDILYREGCWTNLPGYMLRIKSVRYLGARDTDTASISFYTAGKQEGQELVMSYASEPSIPFHPVSIFVHRDIYNWTLYERENFAGPSVCFVPHPQAEYWGYQFIDDIDYNLWDLKSIGSVRRGCDMARVAAAAGDGKQQQQRIVYAPASPEAARF